MTAATRIVLEAGLQLFMSVETILFCACMLVRPLVQLMCPLNAFVCYHIPFEHCNAFPLRPARVRSFSFSVRFRFSKRNKVFISRTKQPSLFFSSVPVLYSPASLLYPAAMPHCLPPLPLTLLRERKCTAREREKPTSESSLRKITKPQSTGCVATIFKNYISEEKR